MPHWSDLDVDGRRLESIIKQVTTKMNIHLNAGDDDLALAYLDRVLKASNQKLQVTEMSLGIKQIRRILEKKYADAIIEEIIPKKELMVSK